MFGVGTALFVFPGAGKLSRPVWSGGGGYAVLVVRSVGIFQTAANDLVDARVDMTVVEGPVAYERGSGGE